MSNSMLKVIGGYMGNSMNMYMVIVTLVLPLLLLSVATWTDIKAKKIPNVIIAVAAVGGAIVVGAPFIIKFAICLAICLVLYKYKMFGAGDGKLASWILAYFGFIKGFEILFTGLVIAAGISAYILYKQNLLDERIKALTDYFKQLYTEKKPIPYIKSDTKTIPLAPCILGGYVICYWTTAVLMIGLVSRVNSFSNIFR